MSKPKINETKAEKRERKRLSKIRKKPAKNSTEITHRNKFFISEDWG